jgi:hypothetical protein
MDYSFMLGVLKCTRRDIPHLPAAPRQHQPYLACTDRKKGRRRRADGAGAGAAASAGGASAAVGVPGAEEKTNGVDSDETVGGEDDEDDEITAYYFGIIDFFQVRY